MWPFPGRCSARAINFYGVIGVQGLFLVCTTCPPEPKWGAVSQICPLGAPASHRSQEKMGNLEKRRPSTSIVLEILFKNLYGEVSLVFRGERRGSA